MRRRTRLRRSKQGRIADAISRVRGRQGSSLVCSVSFLAFGDWRHTAARGFLLVRSFVRLRTDDPLCSRAKWGKPPGGQLGCPWSLGWPPGPLFAPWRGSDWSLPGGDMDGVAFGSAPWHLSGWTDTAAQTPCRLGGVGAAWSAAGVAGRFVRFGMAARKG